MDFGVTVERNNAERPTAPHQISLKTYCSTKIWYDNHLYLRRPTCSLGCRRKIQYVRILLPYSVAERPTAPHQISLENYCSTKI